MGLWICQQVLRTVLVSRLMGLQQSGSRSFEFQPCRVRGFLVLAVETLSSHADTLTDCAVGFAVTKQDRQPVQANQYTSKNQHCSSHHDEWRISYTV